MALSHRRSRPRAYLLLARVSNLPTIWTNVCAGVAASGAEPAWSAVALLALSASCFYTGGMFLNDACDEPFDRQARPERPIPAGDVSRAEAFAAGGALLAAGELLLIPSRSALLYGALLAAAILLYDLRHKQQPFAPIVMGVCRGLVYCIAAASAGTVGRAAVIGAVLMVVYVAGLTVVAKLVGPNARRVVPHLIAGISLVDAAFILIVSGSPVAAFAAVSGWAATLFFQRFVPGD